MAPASARADDRPSIRATVNGQPVKLVFDTGCENVVLFRATAEGLRLKVKPQSHLGTQSESNRGIDVDVVEDCTFDVGLGPQRTWLGVIDTPPVQPGFDGLIGWNCFSNAVFYLDPEQRTAHISAELPSNVTRCKRWSIVPNAKLLEFRCPGSTGEVVRIGIDTGSEYGVSLTSQTWRRWWAEHAEQPRTIEVSYNPEDGLIASEIFRAKRIVLGGLELRDIPVDQASANVNRAYKDCDAVLGLEAFRQLGLIIDDQRKHVYTCAITNATGQYAYNRLGAVFVPKDFKIDDDLITRVIKDSPAYRAGIREGDVLLKIGLLNVTKWRTDPTVLPLSRFWSQPAGTKLKLTLKRGEKQFETSVTLEEVPAVD
jgi:PDZ domain/Aspartyl protease